jgi:predicted ATP-grasp superfamily ATP-dependent carboligase
MRLFVYEHLMAGGAGELTPASLLAEGCAMLTALVEDFATAGHSVSTILDERAVWPFDLPAAVVRAGDADSRRVALARLARDADWSLMIAPEIGGQLLACCDAVLQAGGRLLGPSRRALEVCCDKHATAEQLRAADVSAPYGIALETGESPPHGFPFPAVLKPCDGAGSHQVKLLSEHPREWPLSTGTMRLERLYAGEPTSIALLVGPHGKWTLPPCRQHLSDDGRFRYLGGSLPIEPALAERAERLARRAVAAVPGLFGYVGVDLVLGDDPDGRGDVVIEINPRLTTSYIGLRRMAEANLAAALLGVASGQTPRLAFGSSYIRFAAQKNDRSLCQPGP